MQSTNLTLPPFLTILVVMCHAYVRYDMTPTNNRENSRENPLTNREIKVLELLAKGKTYKEIAIHGRRSPKTIEKCVGNIHGKLGAANSCHAVAIALVSNLICVEMTTLFQQRRPDSIHNN